VAPERIVSLVPSLTEALFAFGAGDRVVGRTRYCLWPPRLVGKVPTVGGTKKVDVRRVLELEPELADADLPDATITEEQLAQCRNLKGATMPDGQRLKSGLDPDGPTFEEWLKDKEGRREE
jgi:hypothetical protein